MRSTILALVATLLVSASPAFAGGGDKGDVELGIYGGYAWLDDYGIFHADDSFLVGARLGYFISRHWGMEFSAQRIFSETEFEMLGVENVDMHFDALRLNALYNFAPGHSVRPFLTGGIGYEKVHPEDFGESCDLGWNAGAGLRWFPAPTWNVRLDGRWVSIKLDDIEERQNNIETTVGLNWMFGGSGVTEAVVPEAPRVNERPSVSCASDRSEILPGESVTLRATATDPEGDPLTFVWRSSTGRVVGSGSTATFDFTGTTAPSNASITVAVSDGHGNTSTCDVAVRLLEPVRQAESVSCLAGGFPRNLSRLNNVDKACLDDVTQRLKADPRARVVIIGHADSHERTPERIGAQRAAAVKDYLVTEGGIEASRITTRSSAASKPLDMGTDADAQLRNRRVEVWFIPEGASEPE